MDRCSTYWGVAPGFGDERPSAKTTGELVGPVRRAADNGFAGFANLRDERYARGVGLLSVLGLVLCWSIESAMLFRLWFYACKIGIVGFALTLFGLATSWPISRALESIGLCLLILVGIAGAILGLLACFGLSTACPFCRTRGPWVVYNRRTVAFDCHHCGLVYGNPVLHFTLRVLPGTEPFGEAALLQSEREDVGDVVS